MYDADSTHERLARLETKMETFEPMIRQTAEDVRAVRDHMLVEKGKKAGAGRTLAGMGAFATAMGTLGAALYQFWRG